MWLDPKGMWATRYAGWPAQRKLEYVDRLMRTIARTRPKVKSKRVVDPLPRMISMEGSAPVNFGDAVRQAEADQDAAL